MNLQLQKRLGHLFECVVEEAPVATLQEDLVNLGLGEQLGLASAGKWTTFRPEQYF